MDFRKIFVSILIAALLVCTVVNIFNNEYIQAILNMCILIYIELIDFVKSVTDSAEE